MPFHPRGAATAIGSFPHHDPDAVCDVVLKTIPRIPIWPQLPNTGFREQMEAQYSEGLPRIVLDEQKQKMYVDTGGDPSGDLATFYENVLADNLDHFKISPRFSLGIYRMKEKLSAMDRSGIMYFKSQITGPVTFGLSVVDESGKALFYNDMFRDVVVKTITMKARWLMQFFGPLIKDQICFVDEPILSAYGSSTYVSVQREDVVGNLKEVVDALHEEGALVGTHCCGNTEWTILIDAGVDIINFDAYEYGETISYYPDAVRTFLKKGGALAWGIIPTSDKINGETPEFLFARLGKVVNALAAQGIDKELIWEQCLLTPSCGTGSMSVELAEKVMGCLSEVSEMVQKEHAGG